MLGLPAAVVTWGNGLLGEEVRVGLVWVVEEGLGEERRRRRAGAGGAQWPMVSVLLDTPPWLWWSREQVAPVPRSLA